MSYFNEENTIYKTLFNYASDGCSQDVLNSLLKLQIISNERSADMDTYNLLQIVGIDKFCEIVSYFNGRPVRLPRVKTWTSNLISALAWYYYTVDQKPVSEIKDIIIQKLGMDTNGIREKKIKLSILELESIINELVEAVENQKRKEIENGRQ